MHSIKFKHSRVDCTLKAPIFHLTGDGDITEQQEPLLSESQDESLTLLVQPESATAVEDKGSSIINVNDGLDESITPLLNDDDDNRNEVMN